MQLEQQPDLSRGQEDWHDIEEYWDKVWALYNQDNSYEAKELLLKRKNLDIKMLGEEEIFSWLEEKFGSELDLKLEKGIIKPIMEKKLEELSFAAKQKMEEKIDRRKRKKK